MDNAPNKIIDGILLHLLYDIKLNYFSPIENSTHVGQSVVPHESHD